MNPPANSAALNDPFTGWDELRPGTWRIERPESTERPVRPFVQGRDPSAYDQLIFDLPVALHCMDSAGRISAVNRQWTSVLGYAPQDICGTYFNDLLTPESRQRFIQSVLPVFVLSGTCRGEELDVIRKDGSRTVMTLAMTGYKGEKGKFDRCVCVLQDTSVQRNAVMASELSDRRFQAAFESSAHGMVLVSPAGRIELANGAFAEFVRRPLDGGDVVLEDIIHKDDRGQFLFGMRQLIAGETPVFRQDMRFMTGENEVAHGGVSVSLLRGEGGDVEQLVVQVVDIRDKKQAAQRLQHAQKMEAVGQLTGGLAHDFNNLLTIIIGNLQLLETKLHADDRVLKRYGEAIAAAQKGSDLTRQLLAFARKQELEPSEVRINDLVNGMTPLIARTLGENVELKVAVMDGEPKAVIDPSQLESSILNLAINARDAMPDGGRLTIETQSAYLDSAYAAKHPDVTPGHYVMVAVSDNGTGIAPELIEKVFQPFFTTKGQGKGSGLGLSMVYGFIKQSGGHISVYSEVGHGTSIKLYLPRRFAPGESRPEVAGLSEAERAKANAEPAAANEPRRPRILVVEDQEAVRAVACGFLSEFGYDIVEAEDGLQALSRLQEDADIDLMFSDVVMPGGMNGFDLAQAAIAIRPRLRIVHTSGYPKGAMVHQEEPRFREGFIIMKPYRREDLQKIIRDALEQQV